MNLLIFHDYDNREISLDPTKVIGFIREENLFSTILIDNYLFSSIKIRNQDLDSIKIKWIELIK